MNNDNSQSEQQASCGSCRYWSPIVTKIEELEETKEAPETEQLKKFGKCRRNPPTMLVQDGTTYSGQPIVGDNEFCGEFINKA
jgi:hypothetical protein